MKVMKCKVVTFKEVLDLQASNFTFHNTEYKFGVFLKHTLHTIIVFSLELAGELSSPRLHGAPFHKTVIFTQCHENLKSYTYVFLLPPRPLYLIPSHST